MSDRAGVLDSKAAFRADGVDDKALDKVDALMPRHVRKCGIMFGMEKIAIDC